MTHVNTVTFDANSTASIPTTAKAILVLFGGNWTSVTTTTYASIVDKASGTTIARIVGYIGGYNNYMQCVVPLDANGQFDVSFGSASNYMQGCLMRVIGYFI